MRLAAAHPQVVRIIAVGNEAMVTWQAHCVPARVVLKHVEAASAVERAVQHKKHQFATVTGYLREIRVEKKIRIGEAGWANRDDSFCGDEGTCATGEYNAKLFCDKTMPWVRENNL